mmetsp:Transcript_52498/g.106857  ORF Transcript_52498/g.106857 Transcript_52498/m.106857 type:complete len:359 (+) Transcript_52498:105-1181(+)
MLWCFIFSELLLAEVTATSHILRRAQQVVVEPNGEAAHANSSAPVTLHRVQGCDDRPAKCHYRKDSEEKRIAVYTYVTGAYEEVRDFNVPCVPPGVDAFFLIDEVTRKQAKPEHLALWRRHGWWVMTMLPLIQGTAEVPLARLAAKSLKFTPPSWMLNGTWDWLVEFDGDISIDMAGLRPMLDEHQDKPLLLLKWYWRNCAPWDCFLQECEDMLTKRKEYVSTSYENVIKWRDELTKYHNDPLHPFEPADYYELGIMFRNVAHDKSAQITSAFKQVLEHCRSIQRDQFLLPFYLWNSSLDREVEALSISKLYEQLKYCVVQTRRGRNLLADPATRSKADASKADDVLEVLEALAPIQA